MKFNCSISLLLISASLFACGDGSENETGSNLVFSEINHSENERHMHIALENAGKGVSADTIQDRTEISTDAESISASLTKGGTAQVGRYYTMYPNQIIDSRGIGLAILPLMKDPQPCLNHCASWDECGSVVAVSFPSFTSCAFHGPSYSSSKLYASQPSETTGIKRTYILNPRTLPEPSYHYFQDRYYTGAQSVAGTSGKVFGKALYTDSTASDWFELNNVGRPTNYGNDGVYIPDKPIEAVVLSARSNDAWIPSTFFLIYDSLASANGSRPFVNVSFSQTIKLDKSCDVSPLDGCADTIVFPATSDGIGTPVKLADLERYRKKYLW